jgi:hypothetical protein
MVFSPKTFVTLVLVAGSLHFLSCQKMPTYTLTFRPPVGDSLTQSLEIQEKMTMETDQQPQTSEVHLYVTITSTVDSLSDTNNIVLRNTLKALKVEEASLHKGQKIFDSSLPAQEMVALDSVLWGFIGITWSEKRNTRNRLLTSDINWSAHSLMHRFLQAHEVLPTAVIFPDKPVGIGSSWTTEGPSMLIEEKKGLWQNTYSLREVKDSVAVLTINGVFKPAQEADNTLKGKSEGYVHIDLKTGRIMDGQTEYEAVMSLNFLGMSLKITYTGKMRLTTSNRWA